MKKIFFAAAGLLLVLSIAGFMYIRAQNSAATTEVPPPIATSTPVTTPLPKNMRQYANAAYHFSISYPDTLTLTEYKEANGAITDTFMNADNSQSFEIYVTPYGGTQIDQTRFKLDEPSGRYVDPQQVVIDGAQATLFTGYNPIMGDTREVWFIHGGYLYEVATYKDLDAWLGGVMQNFKFL